MCTMLMHAHAHTAMHIFTCPANNPRHCKWKILRKWTPYSVATKRIKSDQSSEMYCLWSTSWGPRKLLPFGVYKNPKIHGFLHTLAIYVYSYWKFQHSKQHDENLSELELKSFWYKLHKKVIVPKWMWLYLSQFSEPAQQQFQSKVTSNILYEQLLAKKTVHQLLDSMNLLVYYLY